MAITVYSKPNCRQCKATVRHLDKKGAEYTYIENVIEDHEALAYIKSLGYASAPVVVTDEGHWSGYAPDRLDAAITAQEASIAA